MIKVVLAMRHGIIPPAANFERPSPEIDLERDFPENPLIQSEVKKISRKIADAKSGTN